MNLKEIELESIRSEIRELMIPNEQPAAAFKTVRDQVVFTNKRILVINVQGVTGKKVSYFTYPYSKVQYFGVETAGLMDIDSELVLVFSDGARLTFDFRASVDVRGISRLIADVVL